VETVRLAKGCLGWRLTLLLVLAAGQAAAGPPYLTDDPVPVDPGHWELYLFSTVDSVAAATSGQGPALELNWGAARELQLHLVLPAAFTFPATGPGAAGLGDVTLGCKVRLLKETDRRPQLGVFPAVVLPTGSADRGLGNGGAVVQLPLWVQKGMGRWTTFGGGGWAFNRAPDGRDYPFGGWALQREMSAALTLAGELFAVGRTGDSTPAATIFNAGGVVDLEGGWSLLFSLGQSVAGARHRVAYLGLYLTWGP
jgi:hypothetical protein